MDLTEIKRLSAIARDAGLEIHECDYGWAIKAWNALLQKGLVISEVYRAERDGYTGGRVICEDVLREWIKDNPA